MIDQAVIKEYIWESAKEAFETMIFLPIEKSEGQSDPEEGAAVSLIGTITFTGQLRGSFSILCRMEGVEKIARAMLMIDEPEPIEGADICDALGEVVNLVLGGVKTRLNNTIPDIQISIPTVTQGLQIHPFPNKDMIRADVIAITGDETMKMTLLYKT